MHWVNEQPLDFNDRHNTEEVVDISIEQVVWETRLEMAQVEIEREREENASLKASLSLMEMKYKCLMKCLNGFVLFWLIWIIFW